jgi:cobalt-zinc-cadmium efflux system protein
MGATHAHGGHAHGDSGHERGAPLATALGLTLAVAVIEVAGGFAAHSLSLLSDAAHVVMDAIALGIAAVASVQARLPATERQSYGFARLEMLAALANAVLLFAVTAFIVVEAVHRFASPELPQGRLMAAVAAVGLAVNIVIGFSLFSRSRGDLNVKAALFHVASDAVGAVAVVLGGLAVIATGAAWIDPALSLFVSAIIVVGVVRIVRESGEVLLESAPAHAVPSNVRVRLCELPGVVDVHDLHVWSIGSGSHVLTAHVLLNDTRISEASLILREIESRAHDEFGIDHVTIQFECESCEAADRVICTQVRLS